ncbi:AIPR family protein [Buchananella felis]|uniref:AIPR family protein n=1 Tax=Buchananella felis TaxID=3231492 RepID=UPI00352916E9
MCDALLKSRLGAFAKKYGYDHLENSVLFEKFAIELFLQKWVAGNSEAIDSAHIEERDDDGVDGFAIFINGQIFDSAGDIESLLHEGDRNDVHVVFLQAKASPSFSGNSMARFLNTVHAFTLCAGGDAAELKPALKGRLSLLEAVVKNIIRFRVTRIPVSLFYVTTSRDESAKAREDSQVKNALDRIRALNVYEDVDIICLGSDQIDAALTDLKGVKKVDITLQHKLAIQGVRDGLNGYLALVALSDVLKLVADERMSIRAGIFDDNVRLYQGRDSAVNKAIATTLSSDDRTLFPFLNNGLTILCQELETNYNTAILSRYQIVNGGQTSVEIYNYYHSERGKGVSHERIVETLSQALVSVKLIDTVDRELSQRITVATNSQNQISAKEMAAIQEHAKKIEEYFDASGLAGLRYLRQSGRIDSSVPKNRQFSTEGLVRAFCSAVQGRSSDAIRRPKDLMEDKSVWSSKYDPKLYYFAAYLAYRVGVVLAQERQEHGYGKALYHIVRIVTEVFYPEVVQISDYVHGKLSLKRHETRDLLGKIPSHETLCDENVVKVMDCNVREVVTYIQNDSFISGLGRSVVKDDVRSLESFRSLRDGFVAWRNR